KTRNRVFCATGNHPVLVRTPGNRVGANGERSPGVAWRCVSELRPGDRVVQPLGLPDQGNTTLPDGSPAALDVMRWLGAFIGDGCLNGNGGIRMCIPKQDRVRNVYEALP